LQADATAPLSLVAFEVQSKGKGIVMIRFLTAGESHGKCLIAVLEGLPGGLSIDIDFVNLQLRRRQLGYGRGGRMQIESDKIQILSGVRQGNTIGSPISFAIQNKDWDHWRIPMSIEPTPGRSDIRSVSRPRPGHADLAGALKLQTYDIRDVLERASARETAARVAAGAFCRLFLAHFGIRIGSHVVAIGRESIAEEFEESSIEKILALDPESPVRCADPDAARRMVSLIDEARAAGNTLGGVVETVASPLVPGLGSHVQWDRKLDGNIAQAMMSIPSVKAVEIGSGIEGARSYGSAVHDPILYDSQTKRFHRKTNRAGGIEGGISNGEDIRVRIYLKPIPTLRKPLGSVDVRSKQPFEAVVERSDTCVAPAAGVIAEAMLSIVLAGAFLEKFGGDSLKEVEGNFANFTRMLDEY
jgi:chorismate synthase